jgi:hypothetical protein
MDVYTPMIVLMIMLMKVLMRVHSIYIVLKYYVIYTIYLLTALKVQCKILYRGREERDHA